MKMTALQILNLLQSTRNSANCALLWLNHDRRKAAVHDGEIAHSVAYSEAMLARTDPALRIIDTTDGETLAA
jgi:hypothetical protein